MRAFGTPKAWWKDPVVAMGAAFAVAAHGWMFFVGEYLPYIDWSNHLGLISVLADGGQTGATAYIDRSWAPTPYLLFYAVTALFAQAVSVPAAAKLSMLLSTALCTFGAAYLAERSGRSPRLGLVAPLVLFGYSLGYGFASFVFSIPLLLFALGAAEAWLDACEDDPAPTQRPRAWLTLAAALLACYLGHALLFGVTAALIGIRVTIGALARVRRQPATARRMWFGTIASALPLLVIGLPTLLMRLVGADGPAPGVAPSARWFTFKPLAEHLANLGGHLLERGSQQHWLTMKGGLALLGIWLIASLWSAHPDLRFDDRSRPRFRRGLEIYAALMVALYLFGPESIERPVEVWMVYPRFGVIAALLLLLLPRVNLTGVVGTTAALLALGLVAHNADLNRGHIARFNQWAQQYDPVRARVPKGSRVLALTIAPGGDLTHYHPALGSLYFYHLTDGAAYCAFLFDNPLHPVRPKKEGRPNAPFWRRVHGFDPKVHGKDFDILVLRGPALTRRADNSDNHRRIATENGWAIYETIHPSPSRASPRQ